MDEVTVMSNCLADCATAPATPCTKDPWPCKSKKEEIPMNYASATVVSADTTEKDQRRYLINELYDSYQNAKLALKRKFGLTDDEAPANIVDAVKRIQDGLFVIPEKYKNNKDSSYASMSYLRWRDPKAVEDKIGFEAAKAPLKAAYTKTEREIKIFSPEKGLQSIIDFEAAAAK